MSTATLNDIRVTHARVQIPAWGAWYAEVSLDGAKNVSGQVALKIADVTFTGTVLSGGPDGGSSRSHYRIVGGKGGWGKDLAAKSYTNDLGVKIETVLGDVASATGETLDYGTRVGERVGAHFVRQASPAHLLLEQLAPRAWYVDEAGTTKLGRRPTQEVSVKGARSGLDLARGILTVASEVLSGLFPGSVVDGIEAADVEHNLTPEGLRTTIWGRRQGNASRRLEAWRKLSIASDPDRDFRGVYEYRVVTTSGSRANLQPVRVSTGMPDLSLVRIMPGVAGAKVTPLLGARCLVSFVDSDPARPVVTAFEDFDGSGFIPQTLDLLAGSMVGGEHVATVEGTCLLIYNTLVALLTAAGGGPLIAATLQPLLGAAINAALSAQAAPAPTGSAAQVAAAAAQLGSFASGTVPATTSSFFAAAIAGLETKTPNVSGLFPSLGSKAIKAG